MFIVIKYNLIDIKFCPIIENEYLIQMLKKKNYIVEECTSTEDGLHKLQLHREERGGYFPIPRVEPNLLINFAIHNMVNKRKNAAVKKSKKKKNKRVVETGNKCILSVDGEFLDLPSIVLNSKVEHLEKGIDILRLNRRHITLVNGMVYFGGDYPAERKGKTCDIYIDGSYRYANTDKVIESSYGYGVFIKSKRDNFYIRGRVNNEYPLYKGSSYAEMIALMCGLFVVKSLKFKYVNIYYDAFPLIYNLSTNKSNNAFINLYKQYVYNIAGSCRLTFVKVKGHSDNDGNNIADKLAKSAVRKHIICNEDYEVCCVADIFKDNLSFDNMVMLNEEKVKELMG